MLLSDAFPRKILRVLTGLLFLQCLTGVLAVSASKDITRYFLNIPSYGEKLEFLICLFLCIRSLKTMEMIGDTDSLLKMQSNLDFFFLRVGPMVTV